MHAVLTEPHDATENATAAVIAGRSLSPRFSLDHHTDW